MVHLAGPFDLLPAASTPLPASKEIPFREAPLVALSAGLVYGFDSYAVNIFGMLSPVIRQDLGIGVGTIGTIGSVCLVGYTLGTVGFGWLADKIGCRNALRFSILLYGTTTVLGGLNSSVVTTAILRFFIGDGELAVGGPYMAEVWPKEHRALGTGGIMFALYEEMRASRKSNAAYPGAEERRHASRTLRRDDRQQASRRAAGCLARKPGRCRYQCGGVKPGHRRLALTPTGSPTRCCAPFSTPC